MNTLAFFVSFVTKTSTPINRGTFSFAFLLLFTCRILACCPSHHLPNSTPDGLGFPHPSSRDWTASLYSSLHQPPLLLQKIIPNKTVWQLGRMLSISSCRCKMLAKGAFQNANVSCAFSQRTPNGADIRNCHTNTKTGKRRPG